MVSRPGNQAMEDTVLYPIELRPEVVRAAGLEPATTRLAVEGTPVCASGRLEMSSNRATAWASSVGCEATVRTRTSWFRARRGTSSTTPQGSGRRDSNSRPPASDAGALARLRYVQVSTDGRIRTGTDGGLSAVPLPRLGYVSRVDRAGVEPATFSLQGSCASELRHRPRGGGGGNRTRRQGL